MYPYIAHDLLLEPSTYQFTDVSSENYLVDYRQIREAFLRDTIIDDAYIELLSITAHIENDSLLKYQKKFEVKKRIFDEYEKNIGFLVLFSFELSISISNLFCFSKLSTLLKVNDTLLSLKKTQLSQLELAMIMFSVRKELLFIQSVENA